MIVVGLVVVIKGHFNNVKYLQEYNNSLKNSITLVEGTNDVLEKKSEEQRVKIEEVEKELVVKDGEIDSLKKLQDKIKQDKIRRDHNNLVVSSRGGRTSSVGGNWITMKASAYTTYANGDKLAGSQWGNLTASGTTVKQGRTIAVDRSRIPLGTKVELKFPSGYEYMNGVYTAEDVGGAIKGNRVDVYFDSLQVCNSFGRRDIRLKILK